MSIWRFAEYLPHVPPEARVTLGEGATPLLLSRKIGPALGCKRLYFKLDSLNPTGSYKDRFGACAISLLRAAGVRHCLATSSGNAGSALAAYAAVADVKCSVAVVESAPLPKLRQMMAYGAVPFRVRQFGTDPSVTQDVLDKLHALGATGRATMCISAYRYSPLAMAGVETLAYELAEDLPDGVDHVFCPAGSGGLCVAIARGFARLRQGRGLAGRCCVECVQPHGNATIIGALRGGLDLAQAVQCTTKISGLQVASVVDGHEAIRACRETEGTGHGVSDEQIYAAQQRLTREEGVFCEPSGAASLAGAIQAVNAGEVRRDATIVCLVTGTGFKDEASVTEMTKNASCALLQTADGIEPLVMGSPA